MKLTRRHFLPLPFAFAALPVQAAEKLSINAISNYLNGIKTAKGKFTQINADGSIGTGDIYIRRPGRVRFEYDPPDKTLVMAGGSQLAIFDPKSNQPPEQYPLKRTPLNLILKRNVNLARENMVVGHSFDGKATSVVARDPERPEVGTLELVFSGPPVELRQWVITGEDGSKTTVILGDMAFGVNLRARLFDISAEANARGL